MYMFLEFDCWPENHLAGKFERAMFSATSCSSVIGMIRVSVPYRSVALTPFSSRSYIAVTIPPILTSPCSLSLHMYTYLPRYLGRYIYRLLPILIENRWALTRFPKPFAHRLRYTSVYLPTWLSGHHATNVPPNHHSTVFLRSNIVIAVSDREIRPRPRLYNIEARTPG